MTSTHADRPWSHDIPDGPWDYIVIGSGIGGMAAAALLSKVGRRVLVLEQHNIPGGFTQMFKRPGYRWDVGVHIVGEMSEDRYLGRLLRALTDGRLRWEPVGPVYDEFNFPDGFTIQFPSTAEEFRAALVESFPTEAQAIDDYLALTRSAASSTARMLRVRALPRLLTRPAEREAAQQATHHIDATTAEVLASLTGDPRLRAVLAAQWGYYGVPPSRSSFAMHALMVRHFIGGAYYPVGGASSMAPALLQAVADGGGWTAVRRSVSEIVVRRGAVAGVRLADGTEIPSKRVLSAAGAIQTSRLLGETVDEAEGYRAPGPAHVSLYLGFKGDIESRGAERYCQWFFDSWDIEAAEWQVSPERPPGPAPVLFCSFPSIKDPEHDPGPEQRNTGEVITFVPWAAFAEWSGTRWKKRGSDYDKFKQDLTDALMAQYLARYPGLTPIIDHVEMSTPLSTDHFARSAQGSIYGLGTEPERFQDASLKPKTSVKGLYLGGVDASTPGVVGGLGGGVLAAVAAEPLRGGRFIRPLLRRAPSVS